MLQKRSLNNASGRQSKAIKILFPPAKTLSVPSLTLPPPGQTLAAQTALMGVRNSKIMWEAENPPSSAVVAVTVLLGGPTPMLFTLTTWCTW